MSRIHRSQPLPSPAPRGFVVLVRETRLFWDQVQVQATTPEQAQELALEAYQLDWSESAKLAVHCEVLEVKP